MSTPPKLHAVRKAIVMRLVDPYHNGLWSRIARMPRRSWRDRILVFILLFLLLWLNLVLDA